jgi:hypothetical protein
MSELRNCKKCRKMFHALGDRKVCSDCEKKHEEGFQAVKEYLRDNPKALMADISRDLKMSVDKIKSYLKDGRLEILNAEGNMILECETCGKSIATGRQCEECARGRLNKFKEAGGDLEGKVSEAAMEEKKKKAAAGMRYLNKDRK